MKKTTFIFLLLVVISTMLIAGCTTVQTLPATPAPAVTAVPTYVENQQGVAIIRTVTVTATPTAAVPGYEVVGVGVKSNDTVKVAVKTNESVGVGVKTNQTVAVKP